MSNRFVTRRKRNASCLSRDALYNLQEFAYDSNFIHHISPLTSSRHHLSYDDCLENKGRLQDCSCSIGSYHCIHDQLLKVKQICFCLTGFTSLCLDAYVFLCSCISLHACCIIVTRLGVGLVGLRLDLMTDHPPSVL